MSLDQGQGHFSPPEVLGPQTPSALANTTTEKDDEKWIPGASGGKTQGFPHPGCRQNPGGSLEMGKQNGFLTSVQWA